MDNKRCREQEPPHDDNPGAVPGETGQAADPTADAEATALKKKRRKNRPTISWQQPGDGRRFRRVFWAYSNNPTLRREILLAQDMIATAGLDTPAIHPRNRQFWGWAMVEVLHERNRETDRRREKWKGDAYFFLDTLRVDPSVYKRWRRCPPSDWISGNLCVYFPERNRWANLFVGGWRVAEDQSFCVRQLGARRGVRFGDAQDPANGEAGEGPAPPRPGDGDDPNGGPGTAAVRFGELWRRPDVLSLKRWLRQTEDMAADIHAMFTEVFRDDDRVAEENGDADGGADRRSLLVVDKVSDDGLELAMGGVLAYLVLYHGMDGVNAWNLVDGMTRRDGDRGFPRDDWQRYRGVVDKIMMKWTL